MRVKRIEPEQCCAAIVDLQEFFLLQIDPRPRARIRNNTAHLVRLLEAFGIPVVATLEQPVDVKGALPPELEGRLGPRARVFEKAYFDLTREKTIKAHLARLGRRQVIVSGCETDVCVLQSCLGLLALDYEVYVMEDMIFSSSADVGAALARMSAAGCVMLTYKMLYYELMESVAGRDPRFDGCGPFPEDLPDDVA